MKDKLLSYFSKYNLTARKPQVDILEQLAAQWEHKKYFILSAPVRSW